MKVSIFKTLVLAAVLATSTLSANAAVSFKPGSSATISSGDISQYGSAAAGATFNDYLSFSLSAPGDFYADILGTAGTKFKFTSFDLLSSTYTLLSLGDITPLGPRSSAGINSYIAQAGNYFLHIKGTSSGSNSIYNGSISLATPVPEPETYGMFLAGLGLMGFVASRRKFN